MLRANDCLGIPVVFDRKMKLIANSRGIGRWKKIVVGPAFLSFQAREQQAILLHEVGHCKLRHLEKRLAKFWLILRPSRLAELCRAQEYEADRYAAACGYGVDLARAFSRITATPHPLQPPVNERIDRLIHAA